MEIPVQSMKEFSFLPDSVINIEEVTIKARRPPPPPVYINKYERTFRAGSLKTKTSKDFAVWPSLEYILQTFIPIGIDKEKKKVYLRSIPVADPSALFVLDDIPIEQSYAMIEMISPLYMNPIRSHTVASSI